MENRYTQYILQFLPIYQERMYERSSTMVQTMKHSQKCSSAPHCIKKNTH